MFRLPLESPHSSVSFSDNQKNDKIGNAEGGFEEQKKAEIAEWKKIKIKEKPEERTARLKKQLADRKGFGLDAMNDMANEILEADNTEEVGYLDYQLNGVLHEPDIYEFERGLEVIRKKNEKKSGTKVEENKSAVSPEQKHELVDAARSIPQEQVSEVLKALPLAQGTDWKAKVAAVEKHNKEDKEQSQKIADLCEKHKAIFDQAKLKEILRLNPTSDLYREQFKTALKDYPELANNNDFFNEFQSIHKLKEQASKNFEKEAQAIFDKLDEEVANYRTQAADELYLAKMTGITPKKGTELQFKENGLNGYATITNVVWEDRLDPETRTYFREHGVTPDKQLYLTIEKKINGKTETEVYSMAKFDEWTRLSNPTVAEVYIDQSDLHRRLKLEQFEQGLKVGDELEYQNGIGENAREVTADSVKITELDPKKQIIKLDKKVPYMHEPTDLWSEKEVAADQRDEFTFGEFARWWRKRNVGHKVTVDQANGILAKLPTVIKAEHPDRKPETNPNPIVLKPGFRISDGNEGYVTIKSVSDTEIVLSNGEKMPLAQFVRLAKDNELEPYSEPDKPNSSDAAPKAEIGKDGEPIMPMSPEEDTNVVVFDPPKKPDEPKKDEKPSEVGVMSTYPGLFRDVWNNVSFLSFEDVERVGEVTMDFFKRNYERYSKEKVGNSASKLPGRLGREFGIMRQEAENEGTSKYQDGMSQLSEWDIKDRMYASSNIDETKACLNLLSEKGLLRFDDMNMWRTINRILDKKPGGYHLHIPIYTYQDEPEKAQEYLIRALDYFYGEPSGLNYFNDADNHYKSKMDSFTNDAVNFEGQTKGHNIQAELHNMLLDHMEGNYVNPLRYAKFLYFIIEKGKAEIEDKVFYLVNGLIRKNARGETLLSKRDLSKINTFNNSLPFLDTIVRLQPIEGRGRMPDPYVEELAIAFDPQPNRNFAANGKFDRMNVEAVNRLFWQDWNVHYMVAERVNKGLRAGNMDHDDAHFIIPYATLSDIKQNVLGANNGNAKFTKAGLKNGFAGYGMALASICAMPREGEYKVRDSVFTKPETILKNMIPSYIYYFNGCFKKAESKIDGMTASDLNEAVGVDGNHPLSDHIDKINGVMERILRAYGLINSEEEKEAYFGYLFDTSAEDYKEKRDRANKLVNSIDSRFLAAVEAKGEDIMFNILREAADNGELYGINDLGKSVSKPKEFGNFWEPGWTPKTL